MGRLIAVGDVHGHADALYGVLKEINPTPDDHIIFLGDLINRGPDSKGVIDQVIALSKICKVETICGNHEEMVLAAIYGCRSEHKFWCQFGGIETLKSFGCVKVTDIPREYLLFIANCVDWVETENNIFVHAGCNGPLAGCTLSSAAESVSDYAKGVLCKG